MLLSSIPYKFSVPWGSSATAGYINTPIPATGTGANATQSLGFPPITATPIGSGGVPPVIGDFNGVLNYLTLWTQWVQAGGGIVPYDGTFSTNIGGYFNGALVASATTPGRVWRSLVDNNTVNPDSGPSANWIDNAFPGPVGQCLLTAASATQLKLAPFNGRLIAIDGALYSIPQAGITLNLSGVAASTSYYVYCFNNSGTLTLEVSTTGHATDTSAINYGVEIKAGDSTRTLVGGIYTNTSSQLSATSSWWSVGNWFRPSRRNLSINVPFTNEQTASSAYVEISSSGSIRIGCWIWGDEGVNQQLPCFGSCPGGVGSTMSIQCLADGVATGQPVAMTGNVNQALAAMYGVATFTEGGHLFSGQFLSGGTGGTVILNGTNIVNTRV